MIGNKSTSSKWLNYCILALFVSIKFILQYAVINPAYELHRDEYLHLDQGKHLAWGFISVPPFTSWISHIIFLLGNGIFWVKFFPALFGAMTIIVVWFAIEELHGKLFAQGIAASALVCSVMLRINILYQPNSFDIFCWTILYYFLLKYINTGSYRWLWIGAITCGIAFLNKYNIAFLFFGIIPALLLTNHRKIFLHKQLYLSILLCIAIISPNLIWQYQHNFPVYHHLKTLAATQLVNVQRFDFLKSQLIFFYNSVFILLLAFLSFFVHRVFFKFRVFFYSFVITLLLFLYLKAKDYYAIGLYPILFAFGSVYFEYITRSGLKLFLRPIGVVVIILLFIPFVKVALPVASPAEIATKAKDYRSLGLLRWEDGKDHTLPQDFADMLGWNELALKVDKVYDTISDKAHTIVYCDNYGEAGAINYYSRNKLEAVSMNADYIHWFPPDNLVIKNIIYIKEKKDSDRTKEKPLFDTIKLTGEIQNMYAREQGTRIYLLQGARVDINSRLREERESKEHL